MDLSKKQQLDPNEIKKLILLEIQHNKREFFFSIEEGKETVLDFLQGTVKVF